MIGFEKICVHCKNVKSFGQFYKDKSKKDGLSSWCKNCLIEKNRPLYEASMRKSHLKKTYNLTLQQYDKMFEEQNGVCKICGLPEVSRRLSVDHDHKTGKVRGLLCANCNARMGVIENKDFVEKANTYLKEYNS